MMLSKFFMLSALFLTVFSIKLQAQKDSIKVSAEGKNTSREAFLERLAGFPSDSIFELHIENMGFDELPDIRRFTHITGIYAQGNNLTSIKLKRKNAKHIRVLELENNKLIKVRVPRMPRLRSFSLPDNPIKKLPARIFSSDSLRYLDIRYTHIGKLPPRMKRCKSINELLIRNNPFELNKKNIRRMRHVKTLQLAALDLDSLPPYFSRLTELQRLTIAFCSLHDLPAGFDSLRNLRTLILYSDSFTTIPQVVYRLPQLEHLDFYYNRILYIPQGISSLKKLKYLYLSYNSISVIPDEFQKLGALQKLYMHHNNIEYVPEWMGKMKNLKILDLGFNSISKLPDLSGMTALEEVDFRHNGLTDFPFVFLTLPNTRLIFLKDNPFEFSKKELEELQALLGKYYARKGRLIWGSSKFKDGKFKVQR